MLTQIPGRKQDRDVGALGRARRRQEQEHVEVGVLEEVLDLGNDDAVMVSRGEAAVPAPFTEAYADLPPALERRQQFLLFRVELR